MTRKAYFSLIATCMATAMQGQSPQPFIIEGKIPGLKAGCKVELVDTEFGHREKIAATTSAEGRFRLEGTVESPTICWLDIDQPDAEVGRQFDLIVESGTTTITAAHVDSLPPSFTFTTEKLQKERNVIIKGGPAQQEFEEYRTTMIPYELAAKACHYNMYWAPGADRNDAHRQDSLQALLTAADQKIDAARRDFITRHPDYGISAYLWCELLQNPFTMTDEELDWLLEATKDNHDTARLMTLRKAIKDSRKYVKGLKYTDFKVQDTDKNEHQMSEYVNSDKYTFIDFWASWCGPCRAAIPHVREMHRKYAGRLNVYSVSMDTKENDWRKAMDDEKMEWTQLWLPKELQKAVSEAYSIHGIPYLLLINPSGDILYAGHSAHEATDILDSQIDE